MSENKTFVEIIGILDSKLMALENFVINKVPNGDIVLNKILTSVATTLSKQSITFKQLSKEHIVSNLEPFSYEEPPQCTKIARKSLTKFKSNLNFKR